jgi:STE24 endopeptidase
MFSRRTLALLAALLCLIAALAPPLLRLTAQTPTEAAALASAAQDTTAYVLPPATLQRAVALNRIRIRLTLAATLWLPAQLLLLLTTGLAARLRDIASSLSRHRWVQGCLFLLFLVLITGLLDLPLRLCGHHTALAYGLSVQRWPSWFADIAKSLLLEWLIAAPLLLLLFWIIRRSPSRWWLWLWVPACLSVVAGVFLTPYVIDPLFNRFEPLASSNPALVQRLEQVVARGGLSIPPDRFFLMRASAKSTELNAYVTGFGASKRIVVWDTTIARSTPDQISLIFAHEMGHYALGHVLFGTALTCVVLLPLLWLGFHIARALLSRLGPAWHIPSQQDWAALVVYLLVLTTLATLAQPFGNLVSHAIEHAADVYGQEAIHGLVPDPQATARQSFQLLGEVSLDDPTPHPLFSLWFDTHPTIASRAAFARAYNPWAPNQHPKYFLFVIP